MVTYGVTEHRESVLEKSGDWSDYDDMIFNLEAGTGLIGMRYNKVADVHQ